MRALSPLFAAVVLVALPVVASAKSWKNVTPGVTLGTTVVTRFGEPTTRIKRGDQDVLAYEGDEVLEGTKQAEFIVGSDGKVVQIAIFPASVVQISAVTDTFGPSCDQKPGANCYVQKVNDDDFKTYDWYENLGLVVFLSADGHTVQSFLYVKPGPQPSAAKPHPASAAAAPAHR